MSSNATQPAAADPTSGQTCAPAAQAPARRISCKDLAAMRALVSDQWSDWSNEFVVSQQLIDQFAALSGDDYWIHTDPQRAKTEGPFGTTIAHGMLVQALASRLKMPLDYEIVGFGNMVNYGSDRLRFAAPVPSGSAIRARCRVKAVEQVKSGVQLTLEIAIHVVGNERPSVLNDQVILYM
ncbi:MAG TPA: MaoC family dehydratase [Rubrivivax sp.]|nr:MaoC family dehydratase [Rubrivivax sp.]